DTLRLNRMAHVRSPAGSAVDLSHAACTVGPPDRAARIDAVGADAVRRPRMLAKRPGWRVQRCADGPGRHLGPLGRNGYPELRAGVRLDALSLGRAGGLPADWHEPEAAAEPARHGLGLESGRSVIDCRLPAGSPRRLRRQVLRLAHRAVV